MARGSSVKLCIKVRRSEDRRGIYKKKKLGEYLVTIYATWLKLESLCICSISRDRAFHYVRYVHTYIGGLM